ncbi:MAG TPA: hypothetical protein VIT91_04910 [Chthoniobacterales bacterium]
MSELLNASGFVIYTMAKASAERGADLRRLPAMAGIHAASLGYLETAEIASTFEAFGFCD